MGNRDLLINELERLKAAIESEDLYIAERLINQIIDDVKPGI